MREFPLWAAPVLDALTDAKVINGNTVRALCPAHGGHSLEVTYYDDKLLLRCWAGCDNRDIVAALGLQFSDLFAPYKRAKKSASDYRKKSSRQLQGAAADALDFERAILIIFDATPDALLISDVDMVRVRLAGDRIEMAMGIRPWRPTMAVKQGPEFSFESMWERRQHPFKRGGGHG